MREFLLSFALVLGGATVVRGKRLESGAEFHQAVGADSSDVADSINCPTLDVAFPDPSTLRCEACRTVASEMAHQVVRNGYMFDEVTETICDDMLHSELRQRENGFRFFLTPHQRKNEPVRYDEKRAKGVGSLPKTVTLGGGTKPEGVDWTAFTNKEANMLPCAGYLVKKECFKKLEEHEEAIEKCLPKKVRGKRTKPAAKNGGHVAHIDVKGSRELAERAMKAKEAKAKGEEVEDPYAEASDPKSPDQAAKHCLAQVMCAKDCAEKPLLKAREEERVAFLKYEGAYGNPKFPYVEDEFEPGMMVKNPYAKGGELEKKNEHLQKRKAHHEKWKAHKKMVAEADGREFDEAAFDERHEKDARGEHFDEAEQRRHLGLGPDEPFPHDHDVHPKHRTPQDLPDAGLKHNTLAQRDRAGRNVGSRDEL